MYELNTLLATIYNLGFNSQLVDKQIICQTRLDVNKFGLKFPNYF